MWLVMAAYCQPFLALWSCLIWGSSPQSLSQSTSILFSLRSVSFKIKTYHFPNEYLLYCVSLFKHFYWVPEPSLMWNHPVQSLEKMFQSSLCDSWVYKVFARAGGLNKVSYANKECKPSENPSKPVDFLRDLYGCFCFWYTAEKILTLLGKP